MKKDDVSPEDDDLRPEYDLSQLQGRVRGKYLERYRAGTNLALLTAKGQKLYPRRRFFEEVLKVFRASKHSVPVFNDKHLAYCWADAKWMYDQSQELGFPMMAGSSVPVAWRRPALQPEVGIEWERAVAVGY